MPRTGWTAMKVPYGADRTAYLVIDRFGGLGSVYRETELERADLDLLSGQFNDPRLIAFNTLEHWSQDVSEDIAAEIQTRCDIEHRRPDHISKTSLQAALVRNASSPCGWRSMSWDHRFAEPIVLPDGVKLAHPCARMTAACRLS